MLHIAYHTDYSAGLVVPLHVDGDVLAYRILVRPQQLRHGLADDNVPGGLNTFMFFKRSAADERDSKGLEELGLYQGNIDNRFLRFRQLGPAFDIYPRSGDDAGEWKKTVGACGTNSRERAHRAQDLGEELRLLLILLIARIGKLNPRGQHALGAEARINGN